MTYLQSTRSVLRSLLALVYPSLCENCREDIQLSKELFCFKCLSSLPYTAFEDLSNNTISNAFDGLLPIETGHSLFQLTNGSGIEKMIYRFKYQDRPDLAVKLGAFHAKVLLDYMDYPFYDGIIPIPLHPKKERKRGYNQSELLAKGMGEVLGIPVYSKVVKRSIHTKTQTKMNRLQRMNNMQNAFEINNYALCEDKHILLLDDVFTTGATLEACSRVLFQIKNIKISFVTLALGR